MKSKEQKICAVCNSAIKQRAKWDNPRHDPINKTNWLCKKHWGVIDAAIKSAYKRTFSELRMEVDRNNARSSKKITFEASNGKLIDRITE